MKISLMFCLLAAGTTIYAEECSQLDILKAQRNGASFDVTLRVVDDMGVPVEGARCEGWMWIDAHKDNGSSYETVTDSNGLARVTGKCGKWVSVAVSKEGYYLSQDEIRFSGLKKKGVLGSYEWQPYGSDVRVVLKRILKPCRLIHDDGSPKSIPKLGEWIGYDLEVNQWVKPYGDGRCSDMLVRVCIDGLNDINDFKTSMEVSFTNRPYAGAYKQSMDSHSDMRSTYSADTNALYQSSFFFAHERHTVAGVNGIAGTDTRLDDKSYLVFRTRTEVDDRGRLVSAHYGKIEGLWEFFGSMRAASISFNPTPNDTNLEDLETAERSRRDYLQQQEMRKNRR